MKFLYDVFINLFPIGVRAAALFNPKAKIWLEGRKEQERVLQSFSADAKVVWFHAASVGEFEQGLPVMQAVRQQYPSHKIVLTFFSPSGHEAKKNTTAADIVLYLLMDSSSNAANFLDRVKPELAVFIKYEFWHYYLHELQKRGIPTLLISAVFRKDQPFFQFYGSFFRKMLHRYRMIFTQNEGSAQLLQQIGVQHQTVAGDTRFDRVVEIAERFEPIPALEKLVSKTIIVAGSTWKEDDEVLAAYAKTNPNALFIVAPHDIDRKRIEECRSLYANSIVFSKINEYRNQQIVIIDNIGMLSKLYRYGTITYVGGGFTKDGIHNTLEAAVYYKPVVFGPEFSKYQEAKDLIEHEAAFSVSSAVQIQNVVNKLLGDDSFREKTGKAAGDYVRSKTGATNKILNYIQENRLLIN